MCLWCHGDVWLDDVWLNNWPSCPFLFTNTLDSFPVLLCGVPNSIMSIDLNFLCLVLSFKKLSLVALYVTTGVGGWWCPISYRAIIRAASRRQFTNNAPSSASIALSRTFFVVVHSTCIGPFRGGGGCGDFSLDMMKVH